MIKAHRRPREDERGRLYWTRDELETALGLIEIEERGRA
jgi:hypothetical protein